MVLRKPGEPLYRPCDRCNKMFPKLGKAQKLCNECKLKAGGAYSKRHKFVCFLCGEEFTYHRNYHSHLRTHCIDYSEHRKKSFVKKENQVSPEIKL